MQKSFFLPKWGADPLYPLTKSCVKSKIKYIEKRKKKKYLFKEFPDEKKKKKSLFISRNHKAKFKYALQLVNAA